MSGLPPDLSPARAAYFAAVARVEAEAPDEARRLCAEWMARTGGDRAAFAAACRPGLLLRGPGPSWSPMAWVVVLRGLLRAVDLSCGGGQ